MRKLIKSLTILTLCAVAFTATTAQAQTPFTGEYYRIINRHSSKCVEVEGYRTDNAAKIKQWDCHGGQNQQWQFQPTGVGDYFMVVGRQSRRVLDVEGASPRDFAPIHLWDYVGGPNQQWRLIPTDSGFFRLEVRHTGKVLDVNDWSRDNGATIQQWANHGGANQQFRLEMVAEPYTCNWVWPGTTNLSCSAPIRFFSQGRPVADENEDVIDYCEAPMSRPDELRIELRTTGRVTWWKAIEVLDSQNNVIARVETQDANHGPSVAVVPLNGRDPSRMKLRFLKAKFLGVRTVMYSSCNLSQRVGRTLTFEWIKD